MTKDENDNWSNIEICLRSKAAEFSRFFQGFTYLILTYFSFTSFRKRKIARYLSSYEGKFTLVAILVIVVSFTIGISTVGILKESAPNIPDTSNITIIVYSGFWDTISAKQESSKEFVISNTIDVPIALSLEAFQWNSYISQDMVEIDWDYDGSLIPPNQSISVKITVTNLGYENPTNIILDIIVHGFEI